MMMINRTFGAALACAGLLATMATMATAQTMPQQGDDMMPQDMSDMNDMPHAGKHHQMHRHGPIGVPGRHQLPKGKLVLTYRYGGMEMSGIRQGTNDMDANTLVTTVPNAFAALPGQPPTIRVAPVNMSMDMHMLGAMYAPSKRLTLMGMLPYVEKSMTMRTYAGPVGTTVLGDNTTRSNGLGDIRLGALLALNKTPKGGARLGLGLSLPTGSITETGQMLSPMNTRPTRRLAYSMQLGSGTFDLHPSLTYETGRGALNWGGQMRAIVRLGDNDEGYRLGHEAALSGWLSYRAAPWISYSGRAEYRHAGRIKGRDSNIAGPSLGADPRNYGGDYVTLYAGADLTPRRGPLKGQLLGVELGVPVYQNLNGVQSKTDWSIAVAWRKPF
ncbi:Putative MetA-pathway of phenol degradation [Roseovarius lutimaris]|uniref:Putative MetA-pathway of phenol degradation n=2 Tax=Roseovarius lutimaris TaxID=1005928 RepID=A0A1I4ZQG6_9RHOB|nr:Putative MetA-pathway of phenol degradation [Roseovarius lutimaris]